MSDLAARGCGKPFARIPYAKQYFGRTVFRTGEAIFVPGSSGEPAGALSAAVGTPQAQIFTTLVPGVNALPGDWAPGVSVSGPFAFPGSHYRHLPLSYAALAGQLGAADDLGAVVVQVSSPDQKGLVSLGPSVEFATVALRQASRRIAIVNAATPRFTAGPTLRIADFDAVFETDAPLSVYDTGSADATALRIADNIAPHILDGVTLQVGLGKVPASLLERLHDRRGLTLHSGMLSDGVKALAQAGALNPAAMHRTAVFLGSPALYAWAAGQTLIQATGCENIHPPRILAQLENLTAVNSALEVDLFGQCNLEVANGRQVSGGGGATDFARAARLSPGGLSIVALPSTAGGGGRSRIIAALPPATPVTLGRNDVDLVVTEHGVADLRGRSVQGRAEALIAIADPAFQSELVADWRRLAHQFEF